MSPIPAWVAEQCLFCDALCLARSRMFELTCAFYGHHCLWYPSLLLSHLSLSGNKSHFNGLQKPLSPLIEGTCSQSLIFFEAFLPSSSEKVNSFEIRALFFYVVCLCSGSVSWPTERTVMGSLPKPLPFLRGKKLIIFNFILHSKLLLN